MSFNNSYNFEKINISEITNKLSEITNKSEIMKKNINEYDDLEKYFGLIDTIDENTNDIITLSIKIEANNLCSNTNYIYESICNIFFDLQNNMNIIGKSIRDYLIQIKNEKYINSLEFHNDFFEKNIFSYYNKSRNKAKEFILNENSITFSEFEIEFINSLNSILSKKVKEIIDNNFGLAYEYLNETISYVEECSNTFWAFLYSCEYYLSNDFVIRIKNMEEKSTEIINYISNEEFLEEIENYYYSFEKEIQQISSYLLKINNSFIMNDTEFFYLKNLEVKETFDFTSIKTYIKEEIINNNLNKYALYKKNEFSYDLNKFINNKDGLFYNEDFEVKVKYLFSSKKHKCISRDNSNYIKTINKLLTSDLMNHKNIILANYSKKLYEMQSFYKTYYQQLKSGLQNEFNKNIFKINLHFLFNKYSSEIMEVVNYLVGQEYIKKRVDEYQNNIAFNSEEISKKVKTLNESIINLIKTKYNHSFIINNTEIQIKIYSNIEQ